MKHYTSAQNWLMLIGRILLAGIFLFSAYGKFTGIEGSIAYAAGAGVPFAEVAVWAAAIIELVAGLMLLFGLYTCIASMSLVVLLIIFTLMFHLDFSNQIEIMMLLKNLGLIGGLLYVLAAGSGDLSVKKSEM